MTYCDPLLRRRELVRAVPPVVVVVPLLVSWEGAGM
jgi:hypothetical protein